MAAGAQELTPAARKVLLRLDDGSLLGAAETLGVADAATPCVALDPDRAFQAGRLTGPAVSKLEELLRQFAERFPGRHLRSVDLKRRASEAFEDDGAALRRVSVAVTPRANGNAYADDASPTSAGGGAGSWHAGEFEDICLDIMQKHLWPMFGKQVIYFDHPVEVAIVPDYYKVIPRENARDLGTIKDKLRRRRYKSPQHFYDDMHLFFHNIVLYNGPASPFGKLSNQVEEVFDKQWAAAGLAGATRARRATAGIARPKYEPTAAAPPPEKRVPLARSGSARSAGRAAQPRAAARPQAGGKAVARAAASRGEMPREHMQRLAETLGSLEGAELDGVLQIIRESTNLPADGEIELDFDALSPETLWQLDDYLRRINKSAPADTSFKVEADTDSDEEESESDSAD